jgi:zinc/manganese transport system substrate-binding protein
MRPRAFLLVALAVAAVAALLAVALSTGAETRTSSTVTVVAAENFWGSIATQLGGGRVAVDSIIVNPDTDPHSYDPTPSDARALALSKVAIVNGIGYDNWASQLLDANASGSRIVVDAGDVLGLKDGDNPHQWYSPAAVAKIAGAIVAAYDRADPAGKAYYDARERTFLTTRLARYHALIAEIRGRFAGVPVGYSESIFEPLGEALGLKLASPPGFAKAVAEGAEITAADKQTVEQQLRNRLIKVWVYNSQNLTPDVERLTSLAEAEHIPVATITETLSPASASFQQWQAAQLEGLLRALHRATGR